MAIDVTGEVTMTSHNGDWVKTQEGVLTHSVSRMHLMQAPGMLEGEHIELILIEGRHSQMTEIEWRMPPDEVSYVLFSLNEAIGHKPVPGKAPLNFVAMRSRQ